MLKIVCTIAAFATLVGCAGNGEGLDQNGRPSMPGSASTVLTADFNSIQDNVFTPICTSCHAGANAPRGLRLDAGNSYALLVGVASAEVPGLQRVRPGDPNTSYLIQKLIGAAAVGQRMPLGGPYLPQATIDVIRQWISDGAPRPVAVAVSEKAALSDSILADSILSGSMLSDSMSSSSTSLRVVTTAPLDGEQAQAPLAQIVVGFDRELDANLVNSSTVMLERLDDNTMVDANLSVPLVNPQDLLIVPRTQLAAGTYRLVLRGSGGGALAGLNTRALNSPATNGEGQDYAITFTVSTVGVQP